MGDWMDDDWMFAGGDDWGGPPGPPERRSIPRRTAVPGEWTTAKGDVLKVRDMEDRHLLNTIAFVERDYRSLQDTFCDAALDIDLIWPQHAHLVAEAKRRRLIPKTKKGLVTG